MPPVVVAFPDCFTPPRRQPVHQQRRHRPLRGLSASTRCVPCVEREFGCGGARQARRLRQVLRRLRRDRARACGSPTSGRRSPATPATWASRSATCQDMPVALHELAKHDRSIENFMRAFEQTKKPKETEITTLKVLAMAATYDPDPTQFLGMRLPVDLETCELIAGALGELARPGPRRAWSTPAPTTCAASRRSTSIAATTTSTTCVYGARRLNRALDAARHRPHLRGVPRQPLRRRLPHGHQPAVPRAGAGVRVRKATHFGAR